MTSLGALDDRRSEKASRAWTIPARAPAARPVALVLGGVAVILVAKVVLDAATLGPVSGHMGGHILLMNVMAPLLAAVVAAVLGRRAGREASGRMLLGASLGQIVALWGTHIPVVLEYAAHRSLAHSAVQMLLFGTSFWFWYAVLSERGSRRWRALFALLITGKLFCLLGVLLVFAPRSLYPGLAEHWQAEATALVALADQQQAGLLMVAACPLTYLLVAIVIASRWLRELSVGANPPDGSARSATLT